MIEAGLTRDREGVVGLCTRKAGKNALAPARDREGVAGIDERQRAGRVVRKEDATTQQHGEGGGVCEVVEGRRDGTWEVTAGKCFEAVVGTGRD